MGQRRALRWGRALLITVLLLLHPGLVTAESASSSATSSWLPFDPPPDPFDARSVIDLRFLNERRAGDHGHIVARDGRFRFASSGEPVRFWAVNGPAGVKPAELRAEARQLAKYGVNLVRLYAPLFDERGEPDPAKAARVAEVVAALKNEGIYTHLSIFFPLDWKPPAGLDWLPGYDGKTPAVATLFFNPEFQKRHRSWLRALFGRGNSSQGNQLVGDPALFGLELVNEDSLLFWTFNPKSVPEPQLRLFEQQFGDWLRKEYGSLDKVVARWQGVATDRDDIAGGRMGFRPLWNIAHDRSQRDQDTARFLLETERRFFDQQIQFLRGLGFRGLIAASNWQTASPERLGPLQKYGYMTGDFLDRHGYFACRNRGTDAEWSLRDGQSYVNRSALRFDAEEPGKPSNFVNPAMDVQYGDKPTMLSETAWNRPNRYRSEAPIFLASYAALQDSDAIVHYQKDGARFGVKPRFFMQPWTLMSPAMFGQFPAAALLYRKGLIHVGKVAVEMTLTHDDLTALAATALPQEAAFDELRLKDVPPAQAGTLPEIIDPLVHFVGPTHVSFGLAAIAPQVAPLDRYIDRRAQRVKSSNGELDLDYGRGLLTIAAAEVSGASGNLAASGVIDLPELEITSPLDLAHVVLVSLDGKPIAASRKLLLQVMSEEKATSFASQPTDGGELRISSIGKDPWLIRKITGAVRLRRKDAKAMRVTALDHLGRPTNRTQRASAIELEPATLYYLIEATPRRN